jgi:hypothetical protein
VAAARVLRQRFYLEPVGAILNFVEKLMPTGIPTARYSVRSALAKAMGEAFFVIYSCRACAIRDSSSASIKKFGNKKGKTMRHIV